MPAHIDRLQARARSGANSRERVAVGAPARAGAGVGFRARERWFGACVGGRAMRTTAIAALFVYSLAGCATEPVDDGDTSMSEQALSNNEQTAFNYFVNKGLTKAQAAGVVGNLIQESSVIP